MAVSPKRDRPIVLPIVVLLFRATPLFLARRDHPALAPGGSLSRIPLRGDLCSDRDRRRGEFYPRRPSPAGPSRLLDRRARAYTRGLSQQPYRLRPAPPSPDEPSERRRGLVPGSQGPLSLLSLCSSF